MFFIKFYQSLFLTNRLFMVIGGLMGLFITAYFFPTLLLLAKVGLGGLFFLFLLDILMLYLHREGFEAERQTPERFSNGDTNEVILSLTNHYEFPVSLRVIDELPVQFQMRDLVFRLSMARRSQSTQRYELRPVTRGEYHFGVLNIFVASPLALVRRRYLVGQDTMVPTYPSFLQMRRYQLLAVSNRFKEIGVKKVRRLGHTSEFEQIKEYVRGDDYRTINWKATARTSKLMVNQYADEKAQNVFFLIDKSRTMKMPFEGMSLLDYAINTTLVLSNIALHKHDKAGLITFAERVSTLVPASSKAIHMARIQEALYNQQTQFREADYAHLYATIRHKISHRSLLVLFTNFESIAALKRQMPYLQRLGRNHLLVVIFFENTELKELLSTQPENTEEIYIKTVGEHFSFQKKQIVKELEQHGIMAILTPPQNLTVSALNKYLEIKARGMM